MTDMQVDVQPNGWPTDSGLYADALKRAGNGGRSSSFLVTVMTHGPMRPIRRTIPRSHPGVTDYHSRLAFARRPLAPSISNSRRKAGLMCW